jgi:serpin B
MTYAGARGETASQMAEAVRFELPDERLHEAFNWLDLELASRGEEVAEEEGEPFRLHIVNQLWGQEGYAIEQAFLDTLATFYGAGLRLLDFACQWEPSRVAINEWVAEQTEGRIEDLLPPGAVHDLTRLVLTNAVYFKASWAVPFQEAATREGAFHNADGTRATVPMMERVGTDIRFGAGEGWEAVELRYLGDQLSMVVLVPERERFSEIEAGLTAQRIGEVVGSLASGNVRLTLPRFRVELPVTLRSVLESLGMVDAFDPRRADFAGIGPDPDLHVSEVVHQAFIAVDEEGTEAAAATGVVMGVTAAPPPPRVVTVDRPFVYWIRDIPTGTVLFAGRVTQLDGE